MPRTGTWKMSSAGSMGSDRPFSKVSPVVKFIGQSHYRALRALLLAQKRAKRSWAYMAEIKAISPESDIHPHVISRLRGLDLITAEKEPHTIHNRFRYSLTILGL